MMEINEIVLLQNWDKKTTTKKTPQHQMLNEIIQLSS